jgi:hypothetical protein
LQAGAVGQREVALGHRIIDLGRLRGRDIPVRGVVYTNVERYAFTGRDALRPRVSTIDDAQGSTATGKRYADGERLPAGWGTPAGQAAHLSSPLASPHPDRWPTRKAPYRILPGAGRGSRAMRFFSRSEIKVA